MTSRENLHMLRKYSKVFAQETKQESEKVQGPRLGVFEERLGGDNNAHKLIRTLASRY